ncbi:hypothetical protein J7J63_02505 [Candidatus Bipolaricaulota bacterium]|nr:hypothetical protein [Candidatus Bipolaricaulota bacterium]
MPVSLLRATLTDREFNQWISYFKYQDPDATEIQLATIAFIISSGLGNKEAKFEDYLVHKEQPCDIKPDAPSKMIDVEGTDQQIMTGDAVKSIFAGIATPMGE